MWWILDEVGGWEWAGAIRAYRREAHLRRDETAPKMGHPGCVWIRDLGHPP